MKYEKNIEKYFEYGDKIKIYIFFITLKFFLIFCEIS